MLQKHEPKWHHYIPQFILKEFSENRESVNYISITDKTVAKESTKDVLMKLNLYRDGIHKRFPSNNWLWILL